MSHEHRGLDHKGVMRECVQEWHFCGARDGEIPHRAAMLDGAMLVIDAFLMVTGAERDEVRAWMADAAARLIDSKLSEHDAPRKDAR